MSIPEIQVDFNEMVEPDLVLLTKSDEVTDKNGKTIRLTAGMPIIIYCEDLDSLGRPDRLVANGTAIFNETGVVWTRAAKWCCRLDKEGIRHQSET